MAKKKSDVMSKDSQSRKWQITINNPADKGFDHAKIKEVIEGLTPDYWCMCDEIGEKGTYHTHVYFCRTGSYRFSTVKNAFPGAHIEMAKGTNQVNREYIRKEGKWEKSKKAETNLPDTFEESGEVPMERQGARNDLADLYDMIKIGMTNAEILEDSPQYMLNMDKVDRARQILRENEYKNKWRKLETVYVFGATGTGKTRGVMETYGYSNVYRVMNYDHHPWDGYDGQDVVIFEEFRSSFKIQDMLNYLDGYPLSLPCRYANKVACFTKCFIITNISLEEQFVQVQREHPETWKAFLRRVHSVKHYTNNGILEYQTEEYLAKKNWVAYCENATEEPLPL